LPGPFAGQPCFPAELDCLAKRACKNNPLRMAVTAYKKMDTLGWNKSFCCLFYFGGKDQFGEKSVQTS
jgi:hypothetical protein